MSASGSRWTATIWSLSHHMSCNPIHALAERYRSAKAELQESEDKQKKTRKVRIPHRATFLPFAFAASASFPPPAFHFQCLMKPVVHVDTLKSHVVLLPIAPENEQQTAGRVDVTREHRR